MQWLELTIQTASAGIEFVAAQLTVLGFDSFIIDDQQDFHNFLENNTQYWDYVDEELTQKMKGVSQIRLYLEDTPQAMEQVRYLRDQLSSLRSRITGVELGSLDIALVNRSNEDWENSWKQYYQPIEVGQRLIVVPQWMEPPKSSGRICVYLDPGMIFGTGAHASTQMCMQALESSVHGGEQVLDLGSGSGILSITALLLGAAHAVGLDIDPKAEDVARENAAINGILPDHFTALTGNVLDQNAMPSFLAQGQYDVVLANIVADVIIPMAPVVPQFLKPNGIFICSGILEARLEDVERALLSAGLCVTQRRMIDDWCQLTCANRLA